LESGCRQDLTNWDLMANGLYVNQKRKRQMMR
jgi:hypothetical protein